MRMRKNKIIVAGILLLALCILGGNPAFANQIEGMVSTYLGGGVEYAAVCVESAETGNTDFCMETDIEGAFVLNDLTEGIWLIVAHPPYDNTEYGSYEASEEHEVIIGDPDLPEPQSVSLVLQPLSFGYGEISGTVKLSDGTPQPDAWIYAYNESDDTDAYAYADDSGAFSLVSLTDGAWIIRAEHPENDAYVSEPAMIELFSPSENIRDGIELTLMEEITGDGQIQGQVQIQETGEPTNATAGIWVRAETEDHEHVAEAFTDDQGTFTLTGLIYGIWRIEASPPPEMEEIYGHSEIFTLELSPKDTGPKTLASPLVIKKNVAGAGEIHGQVSLGERKYVPGADVFAERRDGSNFIHTTSDEDGNFTFSGLHEGIWVLHASWFYEEGAEIVTGDGTIIPKFGLTDAFGDIGIGKFVEVYTESDGVEVEITSDNPNQTLAEPLLLKPVRPDTSGEILGRVTLPDGTPVPDAPVHATTSDYSEFAEATTNDEGLFKISELPEGMWKLYAAPPYGEAYQEYKKSDWEIVELPSGGPLNVLLELEPVDAQGTGTISGQVIMPDTSPASYAEVYANTDDYGNFVYVEADENGQFTLESVPEGSWIISAYLWDDSNEYGSPETVTLEMSSAGGMQNLAEPLILASTLDIGEIPVGQIHGSVILPSTKPVPNTSVYAENDDYTEFASAQTDENGNFTLTGLANGTWTLHATPPYDNKDFEQYNPSMPLLVEITPDQNDVTLKYPLVLHQSVKHIQGVVKKGDLGVGGIRVFASNWDMPDGFKEVRTKDDGKFDIWVGHGTWEVGIFQSHEALWVIPEPETVEFSDDDKPEMESITFNLSEPDGYLIGKILPQNMDQLPLPEGDDVGAGIALFNRDTGYSTYVALNPDGSFNIPLPFGMYEAILWLDPERYPELAIPMFPPVEIDRGEKNVGTIYLGKRDATIRGAVTDAQGTGIPGIFVSAWQPDGAYYSGETDSRGNYKISVSSGKWIVEPSVDEDANVLFTGSSQEIKLNSREVRMLPRFEMEDVGDVLIGTVQDENGTKLTDLVAWAYARLENSPRPVNKAWVENGEFRMNVPAGTLYVGLHLDMQSSYSLKEEVTVSGSRSRSADGLATAGAAIAEMRPYEQVIQVRPQGTARKSLKEDISVSITLTSNDAFIRGTLKNAAGEAVTGISGYVSATPDESSSAWQETEINTADGSFKIPVSGGVWNLSYELETDAYMSSPLEPIQVEVATGTTVTQDITLTALGQDVSGTVKDPEGNLMSNTRVWMRVPYGDGTFDTQVTTDSQGQFRFSLPTNNVDQGSRTKKTSKDANEYVYCIGTIQSYCGSDTNCLMQSITTCQQYYLRKRSSSSRDDTEMTLELRAPDTAIKGNVLGEDGATVEGIFVTAYSADGQKAADYTDENGAYELNVAKSAEEGGSNIWTISAVYKPAEDDVYYRSTETRLDISGDATEITGPDLSLKRMGVLPPSETHEFRVEEGWSHTLSDGAMIQIPADAFRTLNKEVKIVIEPRVEDLPDNAQDRNVSYGYVITAYEKSTGKEIADEFNKDVLMTLRYTDDQLEASGIREADIRPAYYLPASDSWQTVKHFTIDKKNNKIIFPTKHFSTWSLVAMRSDDTSTPDPGDLNNDGSVGLGDIILALKACAGFSLSSGEVSTGADVNGNGKIGMEEAVYILRAIAANN